MFNIQLSIICTKTVQLSWCKGGFFLSGVDLQLFSPKIFNYNWWLVILKCVWLASIFTLKNFLWKESPALEIPYSMNWIKKNAYLGVKMAFKNIFFPTTTKYTIILEIVTTLVIIIAMLNHWEKYRQIIWGYKIMYIANKYYYLN